MNREQISHILSRLLDSYLEPCCDYEPLSFEEAVDQLDQGINGQGTRN